MSGNEHLRRVRLAACAAPALFAAALVALPAAALAEDNGRAFFSASGSAGTTPKSSFYTSATTSFGAAVSAVAGGANETFFVVKGSPTVLGEYLGGYVTTAGQLYVLRYDGNVWSNEFNVTVGGDGLNGRRFDIAYEKTTGGCG